MHLRHEIMSKNEKQELELFIHDRITMQPMQMNYTIVKLIGIKDGKIMVGDRLLINYWQKKIRLWRRPVPKKFHIFIIIN